MRIGLDASPLVTPSSRGVRRVVQGLATALEARGRLTVVRLAPEPGQSVRRWRQVELPRRALDLNLSGVHSLTSAFPLRARGARVQTIHELPWRHGVAENADLAHRVWASLATRRATRIVVPTAHVARDLGRTPLAAHGRVRVIPWGLEAGFRDEEPAGVVDEAVLDRYRVDATPFVLCPGAVRAKKNLAAVLRALAERLRRGQRPLRVIVTGGDGPALRSDLGLASRLGLARWVTTLDGVEEDDWPSFLRQARAVPVLSHSEGFGFPVLEALASGTPALVPPDSAQAELAGEAGLIVDPADAAAVADGLERALEERDARRAAGVARARSFTWDAAAERVEALWAELDTETP
jgi:glycosyltransferase involved in cell wall biosynthesis